MRIRRRACWMLLAVAAAIGCSGEESPVGSLTVEPQRVRLGYPGSLSLHLDWMPEDVLGEVGGELKVMVHLLNGAGDLVRTFDHGFPGEWQVGSAIAYDVPLYQSLLGPELQPGTYSLAVGLYDHDRRRWPLEVADGEDLGRREYRVTEVEVPETWAAAPTFVFDDGWSGVEGGADLQVLGRRTLHRSARLEVAELSVPGTAWLSFRIPEIRPGVQSLQLDEGETEPIVTVSGNCGELGACWSGIGEHRLELPIGALEDGSLPARCEFEFTTNFTIVDEASGRKSSAILDGLSWTPEAE